jgi:hypothetical protein
MAAVLEGTREVVAGVMKTNGRFPRIIYLTQAGSLGDKFTTECSKSFSSTANTIPLGVMR